MTRSVCIFVSFSLMAFAAQADDDLPVGVIIYDAAPTTDWAPKVSTPVAAPLTQSRASTRSSFSQPLASQPATAGTILNPASIESQIDLAPGETVLQVIAVPSSIVKIPTPEPVYTITSGPALVTQPSNRAVPEPVVDPFSGRLRDTAGWTGNTEGPASIGCFPAGACAVLNRR